MGDSSRDVGKSPLHLRQNTAAGNFVPECNCLSDPQPPRPPARPRTLSDFLTLTQCGDVPSDTASHRCSFGYSLKQDSRTLLRRALNPA
jgi:hypothetical protein